MNNLLLLTKPKCCDILIERRAMKKLIFLLILLLTCYIIIPEAHAFWIWTPKSKKFVNPKYAVKDTPEEQFKWAMKFYEKKDYKRAAEEFTRLGQAFTDSDLAPEAQYYAGVSYEKAGKPYPAYLAYQKTIDIYPFSKRINEIIEKEYDLANMLYKKHSGTFMGKQIMTDLDRAVEIFRKVKENAPFGQYADQAQFMMGECYKKSELYNEAIAAFQRLLDEYPYSKLREKAQYQVAQCTYLASLRADYDQGITDEAIEEFKKIARQKDGLTISEEAKDAIALLEDKKAKSLFRTAEFYERQKHYKSAAIYYGKIVDEYPESSFSALAGKKLDSISKFVKKEEKRELLAGKTGKKRKKWIFF